MRKNSVKNIRINGEVQKALSEIIRSELKDPRVHPMTSVVQVSVTPDLKICTAYISVLADEEQAKDTIRGLKSAAIYQNPACEKSKSRNTPQIFFVLDQSIEYGRPHVQLISK